MANESPKYDVDKVRNPRKTTSHVKIGASTSVWGMVGLLFVIGLIATVFFAYQNSTNEQKYYFSPSSFLQNISDTTVYIPGDTYQLHYQVEKFLFVPVSTRAYVLVDGVRYYSNNVSRFGVMVGSYEFTINGQNYFARTVNENGISYEVVDLPGMYVDLTKFPDISMVVDAFSEVDSATAFFEAFSSVPIFLRDFVTFQANFLQNMLPWNHVEAIDDSVDLPALWEEAEQRNGRS